MIITNEEKLYLLDDKSIAAIKTRFLIDGKRYVVLMRKGSYGSFVVIPETDLLEYEHSYEYKKIKEREEKLEKLKIEENKEAEVIAKKAAESLRSRIKMNLAFGSLKTTESQVGLYVLKELEKVIDSFKTK